MRITKRQLRSIIREAYGSLQSFHQNLQPQRDERGQFVHLGKVPKALDTTLYMLDVYYDGGNDVGKYARDYPEDMTPELTDMLEDLVAATARFDKEDEVRWTGHRGNFANESPDGEYYIPVWYVRRLVSVIRSMRKPVLNY